jgi:hypothetical protein
MVDAGVTITRSIQSRPWPASSANLEYAAVWGTRGVLHDGVARVCDDLAVATISTLLEPGGGGQPVRLAENTGISFVGCYVLGVGFILEEEEARAWIAADPRNAHVLFPYLNGEDLNSRPDSSPSRWVIDFNDWPLEKAERYPDILGLVAARVRPERQRKKPNGEYVLRRPLPERWWQYADKRPAMRRAIVDLSEVLVIAQVSRTLMPVRVPNGQIFDAKLIVFSSESFADQAVLSSTMHQLWAIRYGTTMRTDPTYTPSTCFDTFARPEPSERLHEIGQALDQTRREVMLRRALGLTKLYNLVNDPDIAVSADEDVARLRQIHVDLDEAVMAAYGWSEVLLEHGFHTYRQMQRWTVSPTARVEILDRLLEENHRRAALQGGAPPSSLAADEGDDE